MAHILIFNLLISFSILGNRSSCQHIHVDNIFNGTWGQFHAPLLSTVWMNHTHLSIFFLRKSPIAGYLDYLCFSVIICYYLWSSGYLYVFCCLFFFSILNSILGNTHGCLYFYVTHSINSIIPIVVHLDYSQLFGNLVSTSFSCIFAVSVLISEGARLVLSVIIQSHLEPRITRWPIKRRISLLLEAFWYQGDLLGSPWL